MYIVVGFVFILLMSISLLRCGDACSYILAITFSKGIDKNMKKEVEQRGGGEKSEKREKIQITI